MWMNGNKYNVIYVDPPWKYSAYNGNQDSRISTAENHYPVMSMKELKQLDVGGLACPDYCYLFLWATFPCLPEAIELMKHWGFTYKTVAFNWVKRTKKGDKWFFGIGYYTRSNSEICLLGVKGSPVVNSHSVSQIIETELIETPIEAHSKKPAEVRDRIVQLCGDVPRIELFAREYSDGWDVWGNEVIQRHPIIRIPVKKIGGGNNGN